MRLSFHLHLPIDREWHDWASEQLDLKYGQDPSRDSRDIPIYWQPVYGVYGVWPRLPMVIRKNAAKVGTMGRNTEGQLVKRERAAVWLLRAPRPVRLAAPLILIGAAVLVAAGTVALGISLS